MYTYRRPRPSFWEGVARIFDFGDVLSQYNPGRTPAERDYLALRSDWEAVGEDLATEAGKRGIVAELDAVGAVNLVRIGDHRALAEDQRRDPVRGRRKHVERPRNPDDPIPRRDARIFGEPTKRKRPSAEAESMSALLACRGACG